MSALPTGTGLAPGGDDVADLVAAHIHDVPDFPLPGVMFKDLTPLFADGPAFRAVVDALVVAHRGGFDVVAGIEARGFVLAAAVAYAAGVGLVPIRKAGKLPRQTHAVQCTLEYGEATLEIHTDAFAAGSRVLVVDDVLATGGTARAAGELVERAGAVVAGIAVLVELGFLGGRARLRPGQLHPLLVV